MAFSYKISESNFAFGSLFVKKTQNTTTSKSKVKELDK